MSSTIDPFVPSPKDNTESGGDEEIPTKSESEK